MTTLTRAQLDVLTATDRKWRSGPELLDRITRPTSVQGLHQTAASLVRRGYIERWRIARIEPKRIIHYQITDRGADYLAAVRSIAEQAS